MIDVHSSIVNAIGPLIDYMQGHGFRITKAAYYEEVFGNTVVTFCRGHEVIQVVRSRLLWRLGVEMPREEFNRVSGGIELFDDPAAFCDAVIAWMETRHR